MLFQGADRNAQSTPSCLIHQDSGHRQGADAARVGQQSTDDHREPDRDHLHRGGAGLGVLGLFRRAQAADQAGKALSCSIQQRAVSSGWAGVRRAALLLIQQGDHPLGRW